MRIKWRDKKRQAENGFTPISILLILSKDGEKETALTPYSLLAGLLLFRREISSRFRAVGYPAID